MDWIDTVPSKAKDRLMGVCNSWIGTPYLARNRAKQMGVDCVNLVAGVFDELYRNTDICELPSLGMFTSLHGRKNGLPTIRALVTHFRPSLVMDGTIEPGDVVVVPVTPTNPNEGHVCIVGVKPITMIHAVQPKVTWTSLDQFANVISVFRPKDKHTWA